MLVVTGGGLGMSNKSQRYGQESLVDETGPARLVCERRVNDLWSLRSGRIFSAKSAGWVDAKFDVHAHQKAPEVGVWSS